MPPRPAATIAAMSWKPPPPGDLLKTLIHYGTAGAVAHGLGCQYFREWMNAIGWRGCLLDARRRRKILKRIREQAAAEGYRCDPCSLAGHLALALVRLAVAKLSSTLARAGAQ